MNDDQPPKEFRHPCWVDENHEPLEMLFDADGFPVIMFDPVPLARRRRHGWDEARQRAFIAMLARTPSVSHAARAVGMSARSAYRLLEKPGAEPFAKAWDMALKHGMDRLRGRSLARSLDGGDYVPVFRKGRLVRIEYRSNDRLAIALLHGAKCDYQTLRYSAQSSWRRKQEWNNLDAQRAEEAARRDQAQRDYLKQVEEYVAKNRKPRPGPRIRAL